MTVKYFTRKLLSSTTRLDHLVKNSFHIFLTSISNIGFGFLFWMIAAKIYSPEDIGFATAMLSSMGILIALSRVGMDYSIIKYFPSWDKNKIFITSSVVSTSVVLILGILFIFNISMLSPKLATIRNSSGIFIFLLILAANSIQLMSGLTFVALRKAKIQLNQSIIIGTRILFLFPLIKYGFLGIFTSIGISFILSLIYSFYVLDKMNIKSKILIDWRFLHESMHFSIGSYFSGLFDIAPIHLLPLLAFNIVGEEKTAYYYMAYSIVSVLFTIPSAVSTSLFVEGSYGASLKKTIIKAIWLIFITIIPISIILFIYGNFCLRLFGDIYAFEGVGVLRTMIIASFFVSVNSIYFTILRIRKHMKKLVLINGLNFIILIGISYLLLQTKGIIGIGYAWIISSAIITSYVLVDVCAKNYL